MCGVGDKVTEWPSLFLEAAVRGEGHHPGVWGSESSHRPCSSPSKYQGESLSYPTMCALAEAGGFLPRSSLLLVPALETAGPEIGGTWWRWGADGEKKTKVTWEGCICHSGLVLAGDPLPTVMGWVRCLYPGSPNYLADTGQVHFLLSIKKSHKAAKRIFLHKIAHVVKELTFQPMNMCCCVDHLWTVYDSLAHCKY